MTSSSTLFFTALALTAADLLTRCVHPMAGHGIEVALLLGAVNVDLLEDGETGLASERCRSCTQERQKE